MPWSFKVTIAAFLIFIAGAALMGFAGFETGWQSLSHFAVGTLTAGAGLVAALLFSVICGVTSTSWRRRSLVAVILTILLLVGLFLFARAA